MKPVELDTNAFEDLALWIQQDRKIALRIVELIQEIQRTPFTSTVKPEPIKHELQGCRSHHITQEHRLVYDIQPDKIRILACRYHD